MLRIGFLHAGDQDDDPLPAGYELGDDGNVRITAAFSLDDNRFNWWGGRCNESLVHDPESEKSEDALPSEMTYRDAVEISASSNAQQKLAGKASASEA